MEVLLLPPLILKLTFTFPMGGFLRGDGRGCPGILMGFLLRLVLRFGLELLPCPGLGLRGDDLETDGGWPDIVIGWDCFLLLD